MFNLEQKIDEIRQKPDHIKVWYVYGAVAACMIFVLFIFVLNVRVNFSQTNQALPDGTDPFETIRTDFDRSLTEEAPTLDDLIDPAQAEEPLVDVEDRTAAGINLAPTETVEENIVGPRDEPTPGTSLPSGSLPLE